MHKPSRSLTVSCCQSPSQIPLVSRIHQRVYTQSRVLIYIYTVIKHSCDGSLQTQSYGLKCNFLSFIRESINICINGCIRTITLILAQSHTNGGCSKICV